MFHSIFYFISLIIYKLLENWVDFLTISKGVNYLDSCFFMVLGIIPRVHRRKVLYHWAIYPQSLPASLAQYAAFQSHISPVPDFLFVKYHYECPNFYSSDAVHPTMVFFFFLILKFSILGQWQYFWDCPRVPLKLQFSQYNRQNILPCNWSLQFLNLRSSKTILPLSLVSRAMSSNIQFLESNGADEQSQILFFWS